MHFDFRSRPRQPRDLEPELRNLIDKALAEGRVKVVPPGVSGLPGYQYDPKVRQIVLVEKKTAAQTLAKAQERMAHARSVVAARRSEAAERRYQEVGASMDAGMSAEEISKARGETILAIKEVMKIVRRRRRKAAEAGGGVK